MKSEPVQVCPYIFYHLTIHANGDISTCFVDWEHQNVLGNVDNTTLKEIWTGEWLKRLRIEHLCGLRNMAPILCQDCPQLIYGQPDNIDKYANEILERIR